MKQFNKGYLIGALKTQLMRVQAYYSTVSLVLLAVAARPQLEEWFPWLSFPVILFLLFLIMVIAGVLDHIFVIRSEYAWNGVQTWSNNNPVVKCLQDMQADISKIKRELEKDKTNVNVPDVQQGKQGK